MRAAVLIPLIARRLGLARLGAVAFLIAALALALAAPAAAAPTDWGVESPSNGERLTRAEPSLVSAYVVHSQAERVDRVEVRLQREGRTLGGAQVMQLAGSSSQGPGAQRSRYTHPLDPLRASWLGGEPLANGQLVVQVRVFTTLGSFEETSDWKGHPFVLDVEPPPTRVRAELPDPAGTGVRLSWDQATVPDFTRYVIQRSQDGGEWVDLGQVSQSDRLTHVDQVPEFGEYRYRVRVFRAGAAGGERGSEWSNPAEVKVTGSPETSSDDPAPGEEEPGEGETGEGEPGEAATPDGEAPAPAPPRAVPRRAPPPPPAPTQPDVFSPTLDYGDVDAPRFAQADEDIPEPGGDEPQAAGRSGMLEVGDRELIPEAVVVPVATGLLFVMAGWHLRRFMNT